MPSATFRLADPDRLDRVRTERESPRWRPALDRLERDASTAIAEGPWTVTDKDAVPPSGDPRDYLSLSEYFWADPSSPDGLPWVLRDGHINPEATAGSRNADQLRHACHGARTIALAGTLLGDARLIDAAAETLRHFFLDDTAGMRPHLRYASLVPGLDEPPGWGLIRAHPLLYAMEAQRLCRDGSPAAAAALDGLDDWFAEFLGWTLASTMWPHERERGNNHTTWCVALVLGLALHLGEDSVAEEVAATVPDVIAAQIGEDGRQPNELQRSRSYFYCCFNLDGLATIADLATAAGVACWEEDTATGSRLRAAMRWMAPHLERPEDWPVPFHIDWDRTHGASPLHRVVARCPEAEDLTAAIDRVPVARRASAREWLLWETRRTPTAPALVGAP